ncbi:MAG: flagellar biosynthetic protein FliO [bacterium]|nr:flagellar biosynthetic protein FliO [bacterium]
MKKIKEYILGAVCWLNAITCYATDKFEILPDLPDPLNYAVQPAEASTVSSKADTPVLLGTQAIGGEPSLISVALSVIFVVILIYLTGILYAKLNKVGFNTLKKCNSGLAKSQVAVVSTTQLGSNKTLHIVELDGKRMLIGASSGTIQLIKDLGSVNDGEEDGEYSHIEIPNIKIPKIEIPKIEIPSIGFSKLITKTHNIDAEDKEEDTITSDVTGETEQSATEEENPCEIIDSLFQANGEKGNIETSPEEVNEHKVDPDEYALYKKYLS